MSIKADLGLKLKMFDDELRITHECSVFKSNVGHGFFGAFFKRDSRMNAVFDFHQSQIGFKFHTKKPGVRQGALGGPLIKCDACGHGIAPR